MVDKDSKKHVKEIMKEIMNIATAKGIKFNKNIIELSLSKASKFPYSTKTSYQRDIESKGKKNEGDLFGKTILFLGKSLGIATPVTADIYSKISYD